MHRPPDPAAHWRGAAAALLTAALAVGAHGVAGDQPEQSMLLLGASMSHRGPPVSVPR